MLHCKQFNSTHYIIFKIAFLSRRMENIIFRKKFNYVYYIKVS